jgi:hypothetical protein
MKLEVNAEDAELIIDALQSSHTYTLDALGNSIAAPFSMDYVERNLRQRERILKLVEQLGVSIDDSYRMGHIIEFARREGHPEAAKLLEMAA